MKKVLLLGVMSLVFISCSTESIEPENPDVAIVTDVLENEDQTAGCDAAEPVVKITNNSLSTIDVQVYNKTGEIVSAQFGITIGEASDWLLFAPGSVRVLITIGNTTRALPLEMDTCMEYHGTLDAFNQLDTDEPTIVL